jgi:hypothetical protein
MTMKKTTVRDSEEKLMTAGKKHVVKVHGNEGEKTKLEKQQPHVRSFSQ